MINLFLRLSSIRTGVVLCLPPHWHPVTAKTPARRTLRSPDNQITVTVKAGNGGQAEYQVAKDQPVILIRPSP